MALTEGRPCVGFFMPSNIVQNMDLHKLANAVIAGVPEVLALDARIHGVDHAVDSVIEVVEDKGEGHPFAPLATPEGRKVLREAINGLISNN